MNTRFVTVLSMTLAAATAISFAPPATACGLTPEMEASMAISLHFSAINRHARQDLAYVWSKDAIIVSFVKTADGKEQPQVTTLDRAADRWLSATKPVEYKIEKLEVHGNAATARVSVKWEGVPQEDEVMLTGTGDGDWKIILKTTRVLSPHVAPVSAH